MCPNAEKYANLTSNLPNHPELNEKNIENIMNYFTN
jgi:dTDP-4-amino-4,6-dideoxygalactose transaminase